MTDYATFRQRLDAVLRTLDVKQVRAFLIAEGQWQPGRPADPEFAMWMVATQHCPFYTQSLKGRLLWLIAYGLSIMRLLAQKGYTCQAQAQKAHRFLSPVHQG